MHGVKRARVGSWQAGYAGSGLGTAFLPCPAPSQPPSRRPCGALSAAPLIEVRGVPAPNYPGREEEQSGGGQQQRRDHSIRNGHDLRANEARGRSESGAADPAPVPPYPLLASPFVPPGTHTHRDQEELGKLAGRAEGGRVAQQLRVARGGRACGSEQGSAGADDTGGTGAALAGGCQTITPR